jgi:ribonucleoside-triphosphate reductase
MLNNYQKYLNFIEKYKNAINASTGSEVDSNANVECKNVTTLTGELYKKEAIGTNRLMMVNKITELYGEDLAVEYIKQLDNHEIYRHDETNPLLPYCVSITMYPFLFNGLQSIGGISAAPTNLHSFAGSFINLVFAVASQFAGAVSTPEFLTYMDYFIRTEYGDDYFNHVNEVVDSSKKHRTIDIVVTDVFQQVVYSLNQPAAARNFQSVFWNIAYFDEPYFNGIFDNFVFPDGTEPRWESVSWLQKRFMNWLNDERLKKVITFPVETLNLLDNGTEYVDKEWEDFSAEMYSKGHSFFTYRSNSVDSLASCCRLRNEISDNTFSFTLGAGGVSTGSKGVITININRLVQDAIKNNEDITEKVRAQVKKIHKYLTAYNEIVKSSFDARLLPVYEAGYISLEKQFLTLGINGFVEGAEFLNIDISPNEDYFDYGEMILKPIYEENKNARTKELMFNTEFVPAENLGVKNAAWDKKDGYSVPRDCYNSYFYIVEDDSSNLIDKFILHGDRLTRYLDGGSALHANLSEHLSKEQYIQLLEDAIKTGCSYFTFNIPNTICNKCGHISKHKLSKCEKCGSDDIDYITRIIGYLKRVSRFSEARQAEAEKRYYE